MDVDKTPTKPKRTPRRTITLPTPPPSSPLGRVEDDFDDAVERMGLVRMRSDLLSSGSSTDVEVDKEDETKSSQQMNPYKRLKASLRLSTTSPQIIVGRDDEKSALKDYLTVNHNDDVGMYVSGPPGTGKTATVSAIGRELKDDGWTAIEVGCMGLKVTDMWRQLGETIGCGKSEDEVHVYLRDNTSRMWVDDSLSQDTMLMDPSD